MASDEGVRALSKVSGLTNLSLNCCGESVTDESVRWLAQLTSLKALMLHDPYDDEDLKWDISDTTFKVPLSSPLLDSFPCRVELIKEIQ